MPSGGMQSSSPHLRWTLRPRTTAALAASGLLLLLFTVSRRIWRGGGRKSRDPGGTESSKKVKEKKGQVPECFGDLKEPVVSNEELPVDYPDVLKAEESLATLPQLADEELLEKKTEFSEENFIKQCKALTPGEQIEADKSVSPAEESPLTAVDYPEKEERQPVSVEQEESGSFDAELNAVKEVGFEEGEILDCLSDSKPVEVVEKKSVPVSEELVAASIIPEVCESVSRQEVAASVVACPADIIGEEEKEVVLSEKEVSVCLKDINTKGEEVEEQDSLVEERIEPTSVAPLTCEVVEKGEGLQGTADSESPKATRSKRSVSALQEEGEAEVGQKAVLDRSEEEEVMQVNLTKSDLEVKTESSEKIEGKKGGKRDKEVQKVELEGVKAEMEVKEMVREDVEHEGAGEVDNASKCEVSTGQVPLDSTGIGSPSMSNFPDNRSEGSSCGDSGKGRSDVTTPGGLEEEEREVSFPRHFSPPCSTSGPEEEEEESVNVAAEDGNIESSSGEAVMLGSPAGMLVDSTLVAVGVPMPVYPGIMPIAAPPSVYEFVIPQGLVGRLIGKHGTFVNLIKARTSASIFIKTHPESSKLKVCAIEGTDNEIQAALDMIREKFPQRRYSSMTLEQVFFLPLPPPSFTLIPDSLHLHLVEGVSNDVILSAMVSPSHYFLQQPTHPTYPTLAKLDMWMSVCYQDANAPLLPENVEAGIICAAPTMGGWYRAQIVAVEEVPCEVEEGSTDEGELVKLCDIRFVDYGGYERLPSHSLRQIRSDFMTLPFQASECYLASVVPAPTSDENKTPDGWSMEAYGLVEELTQAQVIRAQVVGHSHDGLPLVFLYAYSHSFGQVIQVNNELVRRGLAVWAVPVVDVDQMIGESASVSEEDQQTEEEPEAKAA